MKIVKALLICIVAINIATPALAVEKASAANQSKWETLAVKEVKKRYPLAQVVAKHKIWDRKREDEAVIQYHLTLMEENKKTGVFVTISYEPYSTKVNKVVVVEEYKSGS
ncbi:MULTISPECIES: DUF3889 domain-containing protein [Bacillus]|uniref:DUF3889 domain-containing protein n=2 Tax=Bacillus TaxID=1386 RepID=A0A0M5JGH6_9BACI|nr:MULTISPECIES: DUF3889 domain-containing protein [Bacillus]ALC81601.1 hypothetical protein AM592_08285 [Bacillus gobiensis]MBP1080639.1 hypothetical protein [Bacillus capparidis]MED1094495.1 DUF3889 domain-containing protein [Bacillus capparidis]